MVSALNQEYEFPSIGPSDTRHCILEIESKDRLE